MYKNYKVVACVPAGRQRTMSLLVDHLKANRGLIDGVQLWRNTPNRHDLAYIDSLDGVDDYFKVMPLDDIEQYRSPLQTNTGRFYLNCTDADTIYIRFDDDIVYIHEDAVKNLVEFRIQNPKAFVVYPMIWNNAVASAIQQENGNLDHRYGKVGRYCMDPIGWGHPEFAEYIHRVLIDHIRNGTVPELYVPDETLENYLRMSVSCICWFGKDFAGFPGHPQGVKAEPIASILFRVEEEGWITEMLPKQNKRLARVCGSSVVSHFSFYTQRSALDSSDLLAQYKDITQRMYHDAYYRLIELNNNPPPPYSPKPWWERDNVYQHHGRNLNRPIGAMDMSQAQVR